MHNYKKKILLLCLPLIALFLNIAAAATSPPAASPSIIRLGGDNRYETAVKISQDGFDQSDYVVLTSGRNFPDALSAAPLAKKYDAPILLVNGGSLGSSLTKEIKRLGAKDAFLIGGTGVIPGSIEGQLSALNVNYTRIGGADRYETSVKVAEIIGSDEGIVLASGENFPDALSIASIAAAKQMPILLTSAKELPGSVKSYIESSSTAKSYVIGGTSIISSSAASLLPGPIRLSGSDRYETNMAVINEFMEELNFDNVYLATGKAFADALGGSAAASKFQAPIVLVDDGCYKKAQSLFESKNEEISSLKVLGGTGVISASLAGKITNPARVVLGYAINYSEKDTVSYRSLVNYSNMIDEVATYTFTTDNLGNLSGLVPTETIDYANTSGKTALALITNDFDGDVAKSILESESNRRRLIDNILYELEANGYGGVNIDLEGIYSYDRPHYTAFIRELYGELNPLGFIVTAAIPAKTWDDPKNSWSGAFDYAAIEPYLDKIVLMTYDEHWNGGSPGPIASIGWVENVVKYALTIIPEDKIMLGIAAYGYDWPSNGATARGIAIPTAYSLASSKGVKVQWDSVSKSPHYSYKDSSGLSHSVWFENAESVGYKLDLVNKYDLNGIAIWRLGLEDSEFWKAVGEKFNR